MSNYLPIISEDYTVEPSASSTDDGRIALTLHRPGYGAVVYINVETAHYLAGALMLAISDIEDAE